MEDLKDFKVLSTYIDGQLVASSGKTNIFTAASKAEPINNFTCEPITADNLEITSHQEEFPVIVALEGQLITEKLMVQTAILQAGDSKELHSLPSEDILKVAVVNRYSASKPAIGFIKNFGFKKGAIASSVAHDSHNVIAVGVDDESLSKAINLVIAQRGGISAVGGSKDHVLPLPVGGLMSAEDGYQVANAYTAIDKAAKDLGSLLAAPFMTLSFMALLVIPHLKMSDKGLFDGDKFSFVEY